MAALRLNDAVVPSPTASLTTLELSVTATLVLAPPALENTRSLGPLGAPASTSTSSVTSVLDTKRASRTVRSDAVELHTRSGEKPAPSTSTLGSIVPLAIERGSTR